MKPSIQLTDITCVFPTTTPKNIQMNLFPICSRVPTEYVCAHQLAWLVSDGWWCVCCLIAMELSLNLVTNMLFSITIVSRLTSFAFNRHPVDTVCSSLSWGTTFVYYSVDFSAVKFKREIHFTNISNPHTMTALFASRLHSCSIVWLAK